MPKASAARETLPASATATSSFQCIRFIMIVVFLAANTLPPILAPLDKRTKPTILSRHCGQVRPQPTQAYLRNKEFPWQVGSS
ncbi:hypothetical protein D9M71_780660 [compost metagenome]